VGVTDSLGSKITFDAVDKLVANPKTSRAGARIFDRTTQIFMAANQLPILALADQNLDGTIAAFDARTGYPADPLEPLVRRRSLRPSELHAAPTPQVVAFTDPNDVLSYILVPRPAATTYPVVDVVVSNAATYFGLAALPNEVHLGYHANERVGELIACGHPKSGVCTR
jgi:hypothetical protein